MCRQRQHSSLFGVNPKTQWLQRIKLHLGIQSNLSYNTWKSPREGKNPQRHNSDALQSGQGWGVSTTDTSSKAASLLPVLKVTTALSTRRTSREAQQKKQGMLRRHLETDPEEALISDEKPYTHGLNHHPLVILISNFIPKGSFRSCRDRIRIFLIGFPCKCTCIFSSSPKVHSVTRRKCHFCYLIILRVVLFLTQ